MHIIPFRSRKRSPSRLPARPPIVPAPTEPITCAAGWVASELQKLSDEFPIGLAYAAIRPNGRPQICLAVPSAQLPLIRDAVIELLAGIELSLSVESPPPPPSAA